MHDLEQAAAASSRLKMSVDAALDTATVTVAAGSGGGDTPLGKGGGGEDPPGRVVVNGKEFDLVILATGTSLDMASSPLHASLVAGFPCDFVGNLPVLDESLQWSPDERIFVMGALAGAQLGPSAHACIHAFMHSCIHASVHSIIHPSSWWFLAHLPLCLGFACAHVFLRRRCHCRVRAVRPTRLATLLCKQLFAVAVKPELA
jgi:hypothetical protein